MTTPHAFGSNTLIDLVAEHLACESMGSKAVQWLLRQGVPTAALFAGNDIPMLCADVTFTRARFEFARQRGSDDARPAFIWPAFDASGENTDLVAWSPPTGIGTWLGNVVLLGEEQLDPTLRDGPLEIHATVLDWLRAGRCGVVIVDQRRAVSMLREVGPLVVNNVDFGERLRSKLTLKAPRILVRTAAIDRVAA